MNIKIYRGFLPQPFYYEDSRRTVAASFSFVLCAIDFLLLFILSLPSIIGDFMGTGIGDRGGFPLMWGPLYVTIAYTLLLNR